MNPAVVSVLAGGVVGVLAVWPGGVPGWWAVAIAVPTAAVAYLGARYAGPLDPLWTATPDVTGPATDAQAANLASRLAEAATDQSRFRTRVQPRLRRLAEASLRANGIPSMDSPAARTHLGADLHALLTDPLATLPPPSRLAGMLDRMEPR